VKATIKTQLVRIELMISGDRKHWTGMDNVPAQATHSVTQEDHTALSVIVEKIMNFTVRVVVCVNNYTKGTDPIFPSALKK
jgi:hypothetical protein